MPAATTSSSGATAAESLEERLTQVKKEKLDSDEARIAAEQQAKKATAIAASAEVQKRKAEDELREERKRTKRAEESAATAMEGTVQVKREVDDTEEARIIAVQRATKAQAAVDAAKAQLLAAEHQLRETTQRAQRAEDEIEQIRHVCVICTDAAPAMIYLPCGHAICCAECDSKYRGPCPTCRQRIKQRRPVFF